MKYCYYDYEEAYYKHDVYKAKEIAIELLPKLNIPESKKLLKEFKNLEWAWDLDEKEKVRIEKILSETKVLLMVYDNYF